MPSPSPSSPRVASCTPRSATTRTPACAPPRTSRGKRLGVPEYQMTASVWLRGALEHDFGVSQYDVSWYMERSEEMSHGGATGFQAPEGIAFTRIPEHESLASMIVSHQIDAVSGMGAGAGAQANIIDRSAQIRGTGDWSKVKPLFPNLIEEGTRFYRKYGFIPATQMYTIRGATNEKYPWAAFNLYEAFLKSKRRAEETLNDRIPSLMVFGRDYMAQTRSTFGADPFAYGVEANRPMLETLINYLHEQMPDQRETKGRGPVRPQRGRAIGACLAKLASLDSDSIAIRITPQ